MPGFRALLVKAGAERTHGMAAAGGPGEAAAHRAGGPTFECG